MRVMGKRYLRVQLHIAKRAKRALNVQLHIIFKHINSLPQVHLPKSILLVNMEVVMQLLIDKLCQ